MKANTRSTALRLNMAVKCATTEHASHQIMSREEFLLAKTGMAPSTN